MQSARYPRSRARGPPRAGANAHPSATTTTALLVHDDEMVDAIVRERERPLGQRRVAPNGPDRRVGRGLSAVTREVAQAHDARPLFDARRAITCSPRRSCADTHVLREAILHVGASKELSRRCDRSSRDRSWSSTPRRHLGVRLPSLGDGLLRETEQPRGLVGILLREHAAAQLAVGVLAERHLRLR